MLASLSANVITREAYDLSYQINPYLHHIMGKREPSERNYGWNYTAPVDITLKGNKFEATMIQDTGTDTPVTQGSGEYAAAGALSYTNNMGAMVGDVTQIPFEDSMPVSHWIKIGDQKTDKQRVSMLVQQFKAFARRRERTLAQGTAANADQAAATIGGYSYALRDDNTYLTIDRTDVANANFKPAVYVASQTALPFQTIQNAQTLASIKGAMKHILLCGAAVYGYMQARAATAFGINGTVIQDADCVKWGFKHFMLGDMHFMLDPNTEAGALVGIDPATWGFKVDFPTECVKDWDRHPTLKAVMHRMGDYVVAHACIGVNRNFQFRGVTS